MVLRLHGLDATLAAPGVGRVNSAQRSLLLYHSVAYVDPCTANIMAEVGYLSISRFPAGLCARKNRCFMYVPIIIS